MIKNTLFFLALVFTMQSSFASYVSIEKQRKDFLLAERSIKNKNQASFSFYSSALKEYPLYPYLQYQWLRSNLHQSSQIKAFLQNHSDSRYAELLKQKWQNYLAKNKQWSNYIEQYQETNNIALKCHYFRAKYNTGAKKEALLGAKKIWIIGKSLPDECDPIFEALKTSQYFTREMLWQRLEAALKNSKVRLAKYIIKHMNNADQKTAQMWLKFHSNPSLVQNAKSLDRKKPHSGLIFAHAIDRLARTDYAKAIEIWDAGKFNYVINNHTFQNLEKRLAMSLAFRREKSAYDRLSQLENPDHSAKEWRVRAALAIQNWPQVEQAIDALDEESKKQDKWRYWLARAMENKGNTKVASFMFTQLAKERSYYGYLSADKMNKSYQLSDNPIQVTDEVFQAFKAKKDFRIVSELIAVEKTLEAKRQWWYALKKLNKQEILIAAKYAQQLNWIQVAIFTVAKAKHWDDISIRFPLAYEEQVQKNAQIQQLNPALIFGLIRRESAFNESVKSSAGALGLMQIMPNTGKQIARHLKEKWRNKNTLLNPSTNLKYGSYYYKKMLNRFNGHYALAAAAYNAGPHRVNRWLPETQSLAADVWIETIPFKETRAYVSAVLTYALIYQKKLNGNELSMKDFMREVVPG